MAEVTCIVDTAATAWVASTAYDTVGTVVTNDSGRRYTLTTAGTSASSGGPTGTGTGITDGTCVWDYYLIHYTSLSAAFAGETVTNPLVVTSADLVTNDEQLTFSCRASRNPNGTHTADTAGYVDVTGFTVDATRYPEVGSYGTHRHAGVWDATKYRFAAPTSPGTYHGYLRLSNNYARVVGLQVDCTVNSTSGARGISIQNGDSGGSVRHVRDCIVRHSGTPTSNRTYQVGIAVYPGTTATTVYLVNNIVYGFAAEARNRGIDQSHTGLTLYVYNCLCYGNGTGIYETNAGRLTATNCISFGNGDDFYGGAITYCASDDGDGTSAVTLDATTGYSNEFEDVSASDFRLVSGSGCISAGTDLSATFEHDIIGIDRPSDDWDIGPFEFEDAGATATGSATISLSSSGATTRTLGASGAASISATATGASTRTLGASGAPTASLSSDGSASRAVSGSGDTTLDIVASGSGSFLAAGITASGSASIDVTASGEASRRPGGSGSVSVSLSAVGAAIRSLVASGAASITLSSVGTAATEAKSASGSASIGVSSSGSTTRRLTALGAPGITLSPSGSGSVIGVVSAQGQAQVALSATGVATRSLSCVGSATVALASTGTDLSTTTTEQRLQNIESLVEMIFARVYS